MSYFGAISQNVVPSTANSSTTNLAPGNSYTFTGTAEATLGFGGIQVALYSNVACTVLVQQSATLVSPQWDISDSYVYAGSAGFSVPVQVTGLAYRVVVSSASLASTSFRLQAILVPIANTLPRSLSSQGGLQTTIHSQYDNYGNELQISPGGAMRVAPEYRLNGAAFDLSGNAGAVDPNFWLTSVTNSATVTQVSGAVILDTAVTAINGVARLWTARRARFVPGTVNLFHTKLLHSTAGIANLTTRWGVAYGSSMPTLSDGAWFQQSGLTFGLGVKRAGAADTVITGFNGRLGPTYAPVITGLHEYEIYYGDGTIQFTVDGELIHTYTVTAGSAMATPTLYQYYDIANSNSLQTSNTLTILEGAVSRVGELSTAPHYAVVTTAATYNFKYGPGLLQGVVLGNANAGTLITIYDDTTGTGGLISVIAAATGAGSFSNPSYLQFGPHGAPFYNGLKIVSTGTWNATVIFE